MDKRLRPIPYPAGSENRRKGIATYLRFGWASNYRDAVTQISVANKRTRNTPMPGERCGAKTRRGTACLCKALSNGRCRFHGGKSTGPKSEAGKRKCVENLPILNHSAHARDGVCTTTHNLEVEHE